MVSDQEVLKLEFCSHLTVLTLLPHRRFLVFLKNAAGILLEEWTPVFPLLSACHASSQLCDLGQDLRLAVLFTSVNS